MAFRGKAHDMQMVDAWPSTLKHKTDLIQEQLDTGLYSIKRYAFYLQKVVDIRRPALIEIKKATDYEAKEKTSKTAKDAMSDHVTNFSTTQNVMAYVLDMELNFINTIDRDCVQYILNWHKTAEKRLSDTNKKLAGVFQKQRDLQMRITKSRAECHKQWSSLQSAYKDSEKCDQQKLTKKNGQKDYESALKKYTKEIQKTYQVFNQFENEVRDANEQQNRYWDEELPLCIREFEQLETDRLQTWGIAMEIFRNSQFEYFSTSTEHIKALDETTSLLDGTIEIKRFTDELVRLHGLPKEPDFIAEHLPCEYTRVQQGEDLQHLLNLDLSVALAQRQQQQEKQVQHMKQSSQPQVYSNFIKPQYAHCVMKAIYDYPQHDQDDLPLKEGELVAILDMPPATIEESTWWVAAHFDPATGRLIRRGIIPSNYVTTEY